MKSITRPKSLTELVSATLKDWIVNGELELGSQLSEARIAKDLQVSRTPVREAINRLEMEGLLTVEPQRGTFVFFLKPDELAKLCDARVCLENTALREAILRNPKQLHTRLASIVRKMHDAREAHEDSIYLQLDTQFHQCFFDTADNRFLNDAYQTIAHKTAALRNRLGRHPDHLAKSFIEHRAILEAVQAEDVPSALSILKQHIDRKEGSYWRLATER